MKNQELINRLDQAELVLVALRDLLDLVIADGYARPDALHLGECAINQYLIKYKVINSEDD